uniref:Uncharacterized protein n=1 Tax=Hucho hucho TaxID=62062 RepID=A0A4W5KQC9_9TELE
MSADEKAKLYTAIGYSGSSHNLALPKQYVAVVVTFKLFRTSITVREEPNVPEILKVQMIDLSTTVSQRPGAQAIKWVSFSPFLSLITTLFLLIPAYKQKVRFISMALRSLPPASL